jgi:hypothetical protein
MALLMVKQNSEQPAVLGRHFIFCFVALSRGALDTYSGIIRGYSNFFLPTVTRTDDRLRFEHDAPRHQKS